MNECIFIVQLINVIMIIKIIKSDNDAGKLDIIIDASSMRFSSGCRHDECNLNVMLEPS